MSKTLTREGYDVEQAANGEEAWEAISCTHPDALITDIDMPRMTGEELCRKITVEIPDRSFPIIVVTSKTALEHRVWAREMDNVSFIEKPLSLRKLIEHITKIAADQPVARASMG